MRIQFQSKTMEFLKPAKTSRGEYLEKSSVLLSLHEKTNIGMGEAAPLPDLSVDGKVNLETILSEWVDQEITLSQVNEWLAAWEPGTSTSLPSLRFALHSALKNLEFQKAQLHPPSLPSVYWNDNGFTSGKKGLKINGLVWMNGIEAMFEEAMAKIEAGFKCIKIKVGALDFDDECRLLERIRKSHNAFAVELRLDANGGFGADTALEQLKSLSRYDIHSIEQPVMSGCEELDKICRYSPIDVALDESLIGLHPLKEGVWGSSGRSMLQWAKPKYIILKPTLLGGTDMADLWIREAEKMNMGWWSTSALEGNVGLAIIAQWVSQYDPILPQGLGTGLLFKENFKSYTQVMGDTLWFTSDKA